MVRVADLRACPTRVATRWPTAKRAQAACGMPLRGFSEAVEKGIRAPIFWSGVDASNLERLNLAGDTWGRVAGSRRLRRDDEVAREAALS